MNPKNIADLCVRDNRSDSVRERIRGRVHFVRVGSPQKLCDGLGISRGEFFDSSPFDEIGQKIK